MSQSYYSNPLPSEASSTLYVEGLPDDSTEREVAHIFRPFAGYQSVRILPKRVDSTVKNGHHLCFVDFADKALATHAMEVLQGYRMDKYDRSGLHITYAKSDRRERRDPPRHEERDRSRR